MLAGIALGVAAASLGWQVYTWLKGRRPNVVVELRATADRFPIPSLKEMSLRELGLSPPKSYSGWTFALTVRNKSSLPVQVDEIGLCSQSSSPNTYSVKRALPGGLPGRVAVQQKAHAVLSAEDATKEGLSLAKPLVAYAVLATGETVRSKPVALD